MQPLQSHLKIPLQRLRLLQPKARHQQQTTQTGLRQQKQMLQDLLRQQQPVKIQQSGPQNLQKPMQEQPVTAQHNQHRLSVQRLCLSKGLWRLRQLQPVLKLQQKIIEIQLNLIQTTHTATTPNLIPQRRNLGYLPAMQTAQQLQRLILLQQLPKAL